MRIEGFEKIEKPFNDYFDLAISNIPFGDVAVFDPSYTAMKGMRALVTRRIHNYFFVKALDTVRDGGLVAFITSQGVLNAKNNSAARFMMLYHADLVSAIRLPNNLFTENANTEVGSDLIILQKIPKRSRCEETTTCLIPSIMTRTAFRQTTTFWNIRNALSIQRQSWILTRSANLQ